MRRCLLNPTIKNKKKQVKNEYDGSKINLGRNFVLLTKTTTMNPIRLILLSLFFALPIRAQYKLQEVENAKVFQQKEVLADIIAEAESLFFQKVNEYRKSKKRVELKPRNEAHLMALNHSIWMRHHNKLTHSQKKGTAFFSGATLLQRLEFVDQNSRIEIVSENVAELTLDKEELENTSTLAETLAQGFFDTWKNSPAHQENMLDKEVKFHGISILQKDKRFYAAHVFLG